MLSIFEIILLFVVALGCIMYCQMGLHEFLQKNKMVWIAYTIMASIYLTVLVMMFAEFIKD